MRKVIVNSTPLISLCKVGMLDLLRKQYGEITIPEAVLQEVGKIPPPLAATTGGKDKIGIRFRMSFPEQPRSVSRRRQNHRS